MFLLFNSTISQIKFADEIHKQTDEKCISLDNENYKQTDEFFFLLDNFFGGGTTQYRLLEIMEKMEKILVRFLEDESL